MNVTFYGAARSVTGSCHMLNCLDKTILIDCGMRQGVDAKGVYGEGTFPFDAASVDAVLITHAHIDHTGLVPLLVKQGFTGRIVSTAATARLSTIMLPDSGHIQEMEAEWVNRKRARANQDPIEPLYTVKDAQNALKLYHGVEYGEIVELFDGIKVRFTDIGHLLGSAAIEVWGEEDGKRTKVVFSGDVGRDDRPIIRDPEDITEADYLVMESTYGNRNHQKGDDAAKKTQFANVLRTALSRGGNVVIPSFAVGRTQEILYYIKDLLARNVVYGLENVPVYIDSPLGIEATKIYERSSKGYYDEEALELSKEGSPFDFPTLRIAKTADESKAINFVSGSAIIISASGMCDAGRIRHHLKHNLFRADSTILFAGYQAQGTLGRALIDGAKKVKLFGEEVHINATIEQIEGFSGHAGKDELISWMQAISPKPKKVFLVHGEVSALESLESAIKSLGYETEIPSLGSSYDLVMGTQKDPELPAEEVIDIATKERGYGIRTLLEDMEKLLDRTADRRSPDMELKLTILEADMKALVDKWGSIIG